MTPTTLLFCKENNDGIDGVEYRTNRITSRNKEQTKCTIIVALLTIAFFLTLILCLLWRFFYLDNNLEQRLRLHENEIINLQGITSNMEQRQRKETELMLALKQQQNTQIFEKRPKQQQNNEIYDKRPRRKRRSAVLQNPFEKKSPKKSSKRSKRHHFYIPPEVMKHYIRLLEQMKNKKHEMNKLPVAKGTVEHNFVQTIDRYIKDSESDNIEATAEDVYPETKPLSDAETPIPEPTPQREPEPKSVQKTIQQIKKEAAKRKPENVQTTTFRPIIEEMKNEVQHSETMTTKNNVEVQHKMVTPKTQTTHKKHSTKKHKKTQNEVIVDRQREMISKWLSSELNVLDVQQVTTMKYPTPVPFHLQNHQQKSKSEVKIDTDGGEIKHNIIIEQQKASIANVSSSKDDKINKTSVNSTALPNTVKNNSSGSSNTAKYNSTEASNTLNNNSTTATNTVNNNSTAGLNNSSLVHPNTTQSPLERNLTSLNNNAVQRSGVQHNITHLPNKTQRIIAMIHPSTSYKHTHETTVNISNFKVNQSIQHVVTTTVVESVYSSSSITSHHSTPTQQNIQPSRSIIASTSASLSSIGDLDKFFENVEVVPYDPDSLKKVMESKINLRNNIATPSLSKKHITTYYSTFNISSTKYIKAIYTSTSTQVKNFTIHANASITPSVSSSFQTTTFNSVVESSRIAVPRNQIPTQYNTTSYTKPSFTLITESLTPSMSITFTNYLSNVTNLTHAQSITTYLPIVSTQSVKRDLNTATVVNKTNNNMTVDHFNESTNGNTTQTEHVNKTTNQNNRNNDTLPRSTIKTNKDFEFVSIPTDSTATTKDKVKDLFSLKDLKDKTKLPDNEFNEFDHLNVTSTTATTKIVKRQTDNHVSMTIPNSYVIHSKDSTGISKHTTKSLGTISTTPVTLTTPITILQTNSSQSLQKKIEGMIKGNKEDKHAAKLGTDVVTFLKQLLLKMNTQNIVVTSSQVPTTSSPSLQLSWKCRDDKTEWGTDYIVGMSRFLSNHRIKCYKNEFLQEFQLIDNKDEFFPLFRYKFTCCKLLLNKLK